MVDFYSLDMVSDAKNRLLDDVDKLSFSGNKPHIPRRRDGVNRLSHGVDNIVAVSSFIGE